MPSTLTFAYIYSEQADTAEAVADALRARNEYTMALSWRNVARGYRACATILIDLALSVE
jgi:hypothetical protein